MPRDRTTWVGVGVILAVGLAVLAVIVSGVATRPGSSAEVRASDSVNPGEIVGIVAVDGEPLVGMRVMVTRLVEAGGEVDPSSDSDWVTTAGPGAFSFHDLEAGAYRLEVRVDTTLPPSSPTRNFVALDPVEVELTDGEGVGDVELEVAPSNTIRGTVLDKDGERISRIIVTVTLRARKTSMYEPPSYSATPGRRGRYRIVGLPDGEYRVDASFRYAPKNMTTVGTAAFQGEVQRQQMMMGVWAPRTVRLPYLVDISSGMTANGIDLVVPDAAMVSGRVVGADGRPVGGARVSLYLHIPYPQKEWQALRSVWSRTDGSYDFEGLPSGNFRLGATHASGVGFLGGVSSVETSNDLTLRRDDALSGLDLVLLP